MREGGDAVSPRSVHLPFHVSRRATDTPDAPGTEVLAEIRNTTKVIATISLGGTAKIDNELADFIVTACNAHDALVGALQTFVDRSGQLNGIRNGPLGAAREALKLAGILP
jgi:hypothetical protein